MARGWKQHLYPMGSLVQRVHVIQFAELMAIWTFVCVLPTMASCGKSVLGKSVDDIVP